MDDDAITAAGNAMFAIPSLLVVIFAAIRGKRSAVSLWGQLAVLGSSLALFAIALRIGQWLIAIWQRTPPDKYAAWIFDVREPITLISAVLFSVGCTMVLAGFARRGTFAQWTFAGVIVTFGSAAIGYWFTPKG